MPCASPIQVISPKIYLILNSKIFHEGGQGRTAALLSNSLNKGAVLLRGRRPHQPAAGQKLLDNGGNRGTIVSARGTLAPMKLMINPAAPGKACDYRLIRSKRGLLC
jgi:hypothetical protein